MLQRQKKTAIWTEHDRKKALKEMHRKEKAKSDDAKKGLGHNVKKLKDNYARPLLYVKKKEDDGKGGQVTTYITEPRKIDAQVRKEWRKRSTIGNQIIMARSLHRNTTYPSSWDREGL